VTTDRHNTPERILLLCQHFYPEMISTGMHMTELSEGLARLGWQITVFSSQPSLLLDLANPRVPSQMEYKGIKIVRTRSIGSHAGTITSRFLFGLSYFVGAVFFLLHYYQRFDGLLITTNPPFLGLVGCVATRILRKPFILIVYDIYPDIPIRLGMLKPRSLIARIWDGLSRLTMNTAQANVVIGRDMLEVLKTKLNPVNHHKITMIPNWSNEQLVQPVPRATNDFRKEHCPENTFLVQYSGRMARTHNLEPLIEAAEMLQAQPILFQLIGDGAKKTILQRMVQEKRLKNVRFLPYQPLDQLAQVLSAADLAVICLESEFTGLSVPSKAYGIMASATPLLGFLDPESEIGRVILENNCGTVLRDPTGKQVAEIIQDLTRDPLQLKRMGANAHAIFEKHYTLMIAATRYSDLIKKVFA
jgi:glycosyltransferase involved in cell wall biosynthesis